MKRPNIWKKVSIAFFTLIPIQKNWEQAMHQFISVRIFWQQVQFKELMDK
jgi:hypothetical protein